MRHLDAAYNLSLWLLRDPHDAEDATQSALYKAFRAFGRMRGNDAKPWLLAIVRNECMDVLQSRSVRTRLEHPNEDVLEYTESNELDPEAERNETTGIRKPALTAQEIEFKIAVVKAATNDLHRWIDSADILPQKNPLIS